MKEMVIKMKKTSVSRILALVMALMMVFTVGSISVLAESAEGVAATATAEIPSPSANFYIHDEEEVLSVATKNAILTRNAALYDKYGIQVVVLTMKTIPGADINAKGDYLHKIIDGWQIGGTFEKCLVLMLSVTEQNYVAVAGDGLSSEFTADVWASLFAQYLEPDFAAAQYDAGVMKIFSAMADKAELYAANNGITANDPAPTPTAEPSPEPEPEKEKPGIFATFLRIIGILIFVVLVILIGGFIVIYVHGQMVIKKRREARRRRAMQARAQQNDNRSAPKPESYNDFMNRY